LLKGTFQVSDDVGQIITYGYNLMDLCTYGVQLFTHPGRVGVYGLTDENFVADGYDAYSHYLLLVDLF
jgi:hypothetical protein